MGGNYAGSFGIGFLTGSVIGLAIGMLYAPCPGSEMRGAMKGKTVEAKQSTERIIEDAR